MQAQTVSIGPAAEAVGWTMRLKIGRVVTFRASVSKAFRAAVLIVSAVVDLVVIASEAAVDLGVIVLVVAGSAVVDALVALAVAGSEGVAEIDGSNEPLIFRL